MTIRSGPEGPECNHPADSGGAKLYDLMMKNMREGLIAAGEGPVATEGPPAFVKR
jgi:hypothetical protein